mmetsp:Transcript_17177/g.28736  ORF Transcript_17177/g.28736 Transcript_17177/m.28736 type:complete len:235 (-) Transcript_17177:370-1074(-)
MRCQTLTNALYHITIEAAQEDGAHQHGDVTLAQPSDEAGTLQSDVASAHHTGLAGGLLQGKEVIGSDGQLASGARERGGTTANCHDNASSSNLLGALLVGHLKGVCVLKLRELVQVANALLAQLHTVAEVKTLDVILNVLHHGFPRVLSGVTSLPAIRSCILGQISHEGSGVHELLWDTPHIHACATQSPLGALRAGLHKVTQSNAQVRVQRGHFLCTCKTTRSTSYHHQVVSE